MFNVDIPPSIPQSVRGIQTIEIMVRVIEILHARGGEISKKYNRLKSFLVSQIKQGITPQEEVGLATALYELQNSEPGTPDRIQAMENLFELKFLNP